MGPAAVGLSGLPSFFSKKLRIASSPIAGASFSHFGRLDQSRLRQVHSSSLPLFDETTNPNERFVCKCRYHRHYHLSIDRLRHQERQATWPVARTFLTASLEPFKNIPSEARDPLRSSPIWQIHLLKFVEIFPALGFSTLWLTLRRIAIGASRTE